MEVKLAASIDVSRSAILHSSELLAKASIAKVVRRAVRAAPVAGVTQLASWYSFIALSRVILRLVSAETWVSSLLRNSWLSGQMPSGCG